MGVDLELLLACWVVGRGVCACPTFFLEDHPHPPLLTSAEVLGLCVHVSLVRQPLLRNLDTVWESWGLESGFAFLSGQCLEKGSFAFLLGRATGFLFNREVEDLCLEIGTVGQDGLWQLSRRCSHQADPITQLL